MLTTMHSHHQATDSALSEDCKREKIINNNMLIEYWDEVESPLSKKLLGEVGESECAIFRKMKYECNRLYSFQNRWPVSNIKPETLAEAGFFYLQNEDKVQCPFCYIIIDKWTSEDKPLREHMKKSPKCPFLMGCDVGNVPRFSEYSHISSKPTTISQISSAVSYKPKHPRMSDIKRRLLTYSGWPVHFLKPQDLAECGLYYTGVSDVVSCFFCGGSLGNWEMNDNLWEEHAKYFPDCAYLALAKNRNLKSKQSVSSKAIGKLTSTNMNSEIIKQALAIFPEPLVTAAVKRKNGKLSSLQELCDDILEFKQKSDNSTHPQKGGYAMKVVLNPVKNSETNTDALICKICMDRDRSVVFQPCGHLISCWNCAQLINDCPVCRKPILNVIKTYLS